MTDQEGGLVRRLPGAPLLSEKQIGASADPGGRGDERRAPSAGRNLRGVGHERQPGAGARRVPPGRRLRRPVRALVQHEPAIVAKLGADFITAQQSAGVAATAKHFPGLGTAARSQNTDERPVTLRVSLHSLRAIDELPYESAITAGVRLVMVSWALYPALDPGLPAGMSSAIVQGELRQRLGFKGVTVTDALEAGALRAFGTFQTARPGGGRGRHGPHSLLGGPRRRGRAGDGRPGERLPERHAEQVGVPDIVAAGHRPALQPRRLIRSFLHFLPRPVDRLQADTM